MTARALLALVLVVAGSAAHAAAPPVDTVPPPPAPLGDGAAPAPPPDPAAAIDEGATPPAAPATAPSTLRFDAKAEELYQNCQRLLDEEKNVRDAHRCFSEVTVLAKGTEAALKAEAALFVLDAHVVVPNASATPPTPATPGANATTASATGLIPPGRLGITTAAGLFGAWNAVAAGIVVADSTNGAVPGQVIVLGTGVGAVVLGIGAGAGGYFLADKLELDEGAARLVASSLVWGTVIGAAMAPTIASGLQDPNGGNGAVAANVAIGEVVLAGYAFGGGALLLASKVKLDEAQVGFINSGGLVGATLGGLALLDLGTNATNAPPFVYSAVFVASTAAGLGGGALIGHFFDTTWGEVLLCDLGGVLGFVGGGAIGIAFAINGQNPGSMYVATGAAAVGLVGGYAASIAVVTTWRGSRGAPLWRNAPDIRPTAVSFIDVTGKPIAGLGIAGAL